MSVSVCVMATSTARRHALRCAVTVQTSCGRHCPLSTPLCLPAAPANARHRMTVPGRRRIVHLRPYLRAIRVRRPRVRRRARRPRAQDKVYPRRVRRRCRRPGTNHRVASPTFFPANGPSAMSRHRRSRRWRPMCARPMRSRRKNGRPYCRPGAFLISPQQHGNCRSPTTGILIHIRRRCPRPKQGRRRGHRSQTWRAVPI